MPGLRTLRLCGLAAALFGLLATTAAAGEPDERSEPRLILPGDHVVRAGQVICLRWDEAGEISEMEILLSVDGGRHYSVCISPQLDPARHEFVWRVPADAAGELRMRIRFNRDGREIEGAPTAPLVIAGEGGSPEPLGLPASRDLPRAPRPAGRGGQGDRDVPRSFDAEDDDALPERPPAQRDALTEFAIPPATVPRLVIAFAPPRSLPLRT